MSDLAAYSVILLIMVVVFTLWLLGQKSPRNTPSPSSEIDQTTDQVFDEKSSIPAVARPVAPLVLNGPAYIVDGDTLVIQQTQIRLFGIDAPELGHPFGIKAKWALVSICKGQTVRAEITSVDVHGRTVARCYLGDGRDLSAEMVKIGLALDWPKFSGGIYHSLEPDNTRKRLWLADARQKGRLDVWQRFENSQADRALRK